jgi:hypothetical protein
MLETPVQFGLAALVAHLLEKAKDSRFVPWLDTHTDGITRLVTAFVSLAAAVGITYTFDTSTGQLVISGLPTTLESAATIFLHAFGQYWMTKGYYHVALKPRASLDRIETEMGTTPGLTGGKP